MQRVIQSVLAAATLRGTATTTGAEGVMKQCGEQWQAAKIGRDDEWRAVASVLKPNAELRLVPELRPASGSQPQTGSLFQWQTPAAPSQLRWSRRPLATNAS